MSHLVYCSLFAGIKADSATVHIRLDHNRTIIKAGIYLPDGSIQMINAWVDNGNPVLSITERLAKELALTISVDSSGSMQVTGNIPVKIRIGGMDIFLKDLGQPIEVVKGARIGAGIDADINIPSTVLKNYDVVVDYPSKEFTIAAPGSIHFKGKAVKGFFNAENFLIQMAVRSDYDEFHLALDLGTPVSFISRDQISKWIKDHPTWPSMHGAIGITNLWGMEDEPDWQLLRINNLLYGGITLSNFIAVSCPPDWLDYFTKRVGIPTAGLIGAEALLDYSIGIDYVHKTVYFKRLSNAATEDMDFVGLILRPESNGVYRILGVADYNGNPSVAGAMKGDVLLKVNDNPVDGLTMGGVWSLLQGHPGAIDNLELERDGKTFIIKTKVRRFLSN